MKIVGQAETSQNTEKSPRDSRERLSANAGGNNDNDNNTSFFKFFYFRARKILKTKLYDRNLVKGINTWAVLLVRYSRPFLKWT